MENKRKYNCDNRDLIFEGEYLNLMEIYMIKIILFEK